MVAFPWHSTSGKQLFLSWESTKAGVGLQRIERSNQTSLYTRPASDTWLSSMKEALESDQLPAIYIGLLLVDGTRESHRIPPVHARGQDARRQLERRSVGRRSPQPVVY